MSSYRNHIKKMNDILLKSNSVSSDNVQEIVSKIPKVVKPRKPIKVLPVISDLEKSQIEKIDDFHEFIEGRPNDLEEE